MPEYSRHQWLVCSCILVQYKNELISLISVAYFTTPLWLKHRTHNIFAKWS